MPTAPHTAILLLNYNGRTLLEQYLPLLKNTSYPNKKIYVIDNGSTDDSTAFLKKAHPDITIVDNEKNLGYAAGYNKGLSGIEADYFILLNTDVEPTPGFIEPLVALMEEDATIGICQPKILSLTNRQQFEYAGGAGGWIDTLGYTFARGRLFDHCEEDQGQYDTDIEIFWASGACLLIRPALFRQLDGFYDHFFMYSEEVDLCWRARIAGFKIVACPRSTIYHRETPPFAASPQRIYYNFRNNLIMLQRNLPASRLLLLMPLRWLLNGLTLLGFLIQGRPVAAGKIFSAHIGFLKWFFFVKGSSTPQKKSPFPTWGQPTKDPRPFNIFSSAKEPSDN